MVFTPTPKSSETLVWGCTIPPTSSFFQKEKEGGLVLNNEGLSV